jgi:mRNA-degrading endonuclease toxin of MazEF toxin-antitoxin module
MRHNRTSHNPHNHYAANVSGSGPYVLAQLQEVSSTGHCEQVRVVLTPAEARHFAELPTAAADRAEVRVGAPD